MDEYELSKSIADFHEQIIDKRQNSLDEIHDIDNMIKQLSIDIIELEKKAQSKTKTLKILKKRLVDLERDFHEKYS